MGGGKDGEIYDLQWFPWSIVVLVVGITGVAAEEHADEAFPQGGSVFLLFVFLWLWLLFMMLIMVMIIQGGGC